MRLEIYDTANNQIFLLALADELKLGTVEKIINLIRKENLMSDEEKVEAEGAAEQSVPEAPAAEEPKAE